MLHDLLFVLSFTHSYLCLCSGLLHLLYAKNVLTVRNPPKTWPCLVASLQIVFTIQAQHFWPACITALFTMHPLTQIEKKGTNHKREPPEEAETPG